jgi:single-stranded DNA-binding protein
MARVELKGGVTQSNDPKPLFERWVIEFTVAEEEMVWNSQTQQREPQSTFWRVSWWMDEFPGPQQLVFKGDKVFVMGELTQEKKKAGQEGPSHTRIYPYTVTVIRRGKEGKSFLSTGGQPAQQQPAAQQGSDPWAPKGDEPPF